MLLKLFKLQKFNLVIIKGFCVFIFSSLSFQAEASSYYVTRIDEVQDTGQDLSPSSLNYWGTSLKFNGSNPAVAYPDFLASGGYERLKYSYYNGSSWSTPEVVHTIAGGNVGSAPSLQFYGGQPRISYTESYNAILRYASKPASSWIIQTADGSGPTGMYTNLALDSSGNPYISYWRNNSSSSLRDLKFAKRISGAWSNQTADGASSTNDLGAYNSMVFNSPTDIVISYADLTDNNLKLATYNGSAWSVGTIDNSADEVGWHTSIVKDNRGFYHISYYDNTNGNLKYVYSDFDGWNTPVIVDGASGDNVGRHTSIALDSDGNTVIVYYDVTNTRLKMARNKLAGVGGVDWDIQVIDDTGNVGTNTSIKFRSDGHGAVSYTRESDGVTTQLLKVAWLEKGNLVSGNQTNVDIRTGELTYTGSDTAGGITFDFISVLGDGRVRKEAYGGTEADFFAGPAMVDNIFDMWEIVLDDTTLGDTAVFTFNYGTTSILDQLAASGYSESDLRIFHRLGNGSVEELPIQAIDTLNNTIRVTTTGFSGFGIGTAVPEPFTWLMLLLGLFGISCKKFFSRR